MQRSVLKVDSTGPSFSLFMHVCIHVHSYMCVYICTRTHIYLPAATASAPPDSFKGHPNLQSTKTDMTYTPSHECACMPTCGNTYVYITTYLLRQRLHLLHPLEHHPNLPAKAAAGGHTPLQRGDPVCVYV